MQNIISVYYIAIGFMLAVLPKFTTCSIFAHAGFMPCWESAKLLTITGGAVMLLGMVFRFQKKAGFKVATHAVTMGMAYMSAMIPAILVGGCADPHMFCHTAGFPMVYVMSAVLGLVAAASLCGTVVTMTEDAAIERTAKDRMTA